MTVVCTQCGKTRSYPFRLAARRDGWRWFKNLAWCKDCENQLLQEAFLKLKGATKTKET